MTEAASLRVSRSGLAAAVVVLAAFCLLVGLGVWQLARLEWKTALIDTIETRMDQPPASLAEALAAGEDAAFRPVLARGAFLHDQALHLMGRVHKGRLGVHMVTPLVREDGAAVLVDRGWVPLTEDGRIAPYDTPEGTVTVRGILRPPSEPNPFTPDNQPAENAWYWIDIDTVAEGLGQPLVPYYIAAEGGADTGFPVAAGTEIEIANNHLQYAITWFGLAAGLLAVCGFYLYKRRG